MRDFRFGFNMSGLRPADEVAELCRSGEEIGYDIVLGTDHLTTGSPFAPLVAATMATERMRVGTLTVNNEFWNPALLAREAITVDMLTGGRLELGIGAGHMKWEFDAAGLPWRPFGERVGRLAASVTELRRLFADGVPEPETTAQAREAVGRPAMAPVQKHGFGGHGPPLLIGGTGDRILRIAAQHADIVGFTGTRQAKGAPPGTFELITADETAERVAFVRAEAGERADDLEFNVLVQYVAVTDDRRGMAENLVAQTSYYTVDEALDSPYLLFGTVEQLADRLLENRERFGFSYICVHEPYRRELAPVIERLRG